MLAAYITYTFGKMRNCMVVFMNWGSYQRPAVHDHNKSVAERVS